MILPVTIALFGTLLGILLIKSIFPKIGLMDRPERYGHKRSPVPYPAGIILPVIFSIIAFLILPHDKHLFGFLSAAWVLVMTSFVDDRIGLSPFFRLGIQISCAVIVVASGIGIDFVSNPFGGAIDLRMGQIPIDFFGTTHSFAPRADLFTIVWLLLIINAFNWLDGVSGLTSSVSAIAGFVIAALAYSVGQPEIALLALCFGLASAIFFLFDFAPPKILMGDTGSMFLGFTIAMLSIFSSGKIATAFLVLGVPLFDAVRTILRRIVAGKSPFHGDMEHFHHRLLRGGLTERQTVAVVAGISFLFGSSALLLSGYEKFWAILLLGFLMLAILWGVQQKESR